MVGKSDHLHAVHVQDAQAAPGDIRTVRIVGSGTNSLSGKLAD
jgi:tRNA-2-methylthio-N6-dimethylallyladenosine synthase